MENESYILSYFQFVQKVKDVLSAWSDVITSAQFVIDTNAVYFTLQTGFLVSLPYVIKAIVGPSGGVLADMLITYKMSVRNVRRLIFSFGE